MILLSLIYTNCPLDHIWILPPVTQQQAQSPVKPRLDHETLRLQEGHHPAKVLQRSATVVTQGSDTAGEQDFTGNDSSLGYLLSNPQTATSLHQFDNKRSRDSAFTVASSSTDYPAKQIALIRPSEANPNMGYGHVPLSDRSASPSSLQCISALTMLCGAKVTPDINMSKAIEAESQKNDSKDWYVSAGGCSECLGNDETYQ